MAVTADQLIKAREPGRLREFIVKTSEVIYAGTMVYIETSSGLAIPSITGSVKFAGIAKSKVTGDGTLKVELYTEGAFEITCSGTLTQADVGKRMEGTDNYNCKVADVLGATEQCIVGYLTKYISATLGEIEIAPTSMLSSIV